MWRNEVGPHPLMMVDNPVRAEMWSIADRVAVCDGDHFEAQRRSRTDRRVDAQVGGPSCHQQAIRAEPGEIRLKGGAEEWIVQRLADDTVAWFGVDRAQKVPSGCEWLEVVASWSCVLNKEHRPTGAAHPQSQAIDSLDDSDEIVLRCASQKALLHVNDQEHVHSPPPRLLCRSLRRRPPSCDALHQPQPRRLSCPTASLTSPFCTA